MSKKVLIAFEQQRRFAKIEISTPLRKLLRSLMHELIDSLLDEHDDVEITLLSDVDPASRDERVRYIQVVDNDDLQQKLRYLVTQSGIAYDIVVKFADVPVKIAAYKSIGVPPPHIDAPHADCDVRLTQISANVKHRGDHLFMRILFDDDDARRDVFLRGQHASFTVQGLQKLPRITDDINKWIELCDDDQRNVVLLIGDAHDARANRDDDTRGQYGAIMLSRNGGTQLNDVNKIGTYIRATVEELLLTRGKHEHD